MTKKATKLQGLFADTKTADLNTTIANSGAGTFGDLARMGGDVAANVTLEELATRGAGFHEDLARMKLRESTPTPPMIDELAISGEPITSIEVGIKYEFPTTATGGNPPYVFALTGPWPMGIVINKDTGIVKGNAGTAGTYTNLSVSVSDTGAGEAHLPEFELEVTEPVARKSKK
jgi:hypothetical protein